MLALNQPAEPTWPTEKQAGWETCPTHNHAIHSAILALWLFASCGCNQFDLNRPFPWQDTDEVLRPTKVVPIWTDTLMYQAGTPAVRGFGGRIYFYDEANRNPIRVEGALTVYAFDAEQPHGWKPEKKFVLTAEQLERHYSKTSLGHSYSIWLPWDEVGGPSRKVRLIARLECADGGVAMSEPAHKLLPGIPTGDDLMLPNSEDAADRPKTVNPVSQVSFDQDEQPSRTESNVERAITIDLPPGFARHLRKDVSLDAASGERLLLPVNDRYPPERTIQPVCYFGFGSKSWGATVSWF